MIDDVALNFSPGSLYLLNAILAVVMFSIAIDILPRDFTALGLDLQGLPAMRDIDFTLGAGYETGNWMFDFLNSYQYNIAGGSNEIQRNIIAERVLGMPQEKLV